MRRALGGHLTGRTAALITLETVLIVASVVLATYLRLRQWPWQEVPEGGGDLVKALLIAVVCQLSLYWLDLYDLRVVADRREMFVRLVRALGVTALTLAVIYFWFPALVIGRGVFLIAAVLALTFITAWRLAFEWLTHRVSPRERLLLVGTSPAAIDLARELHERRAELGVEIAGFVDADPARVGAPVINPGIIGTIEDIPAIVRARAVDRVVVSLADARGKLPMDKLLEMKLEGVTFDHLPSVYEDYTGKIAVESLRPSWLIFSRGFRKSSVLQAAKRTLDVVSAVIGLVVGLPLMLLVAAAVKASSPGPVFYRQQRVGRYGRLFTVHKFRSMCHDAEAQTGAVWAAKNDVRITAVGRVLRRTRLDELPQLWNVLTGEMSLVGPRPERPEFVSQLTVEIPFYGQRHVVRPGLTGWAQVCYTYAASVEDATEKLQYDLYYIKNMSLAFDLFIILLTLKTVILGRGAS
jgi:sugar transferase (PEP-CTERM system associated)